MEIIASSIIINGLTISTLFIDNPIIKEYKLLAVMKYWRICKNDLQNHNLRKTKRNKKCTFRNFILRDYKIVVNHNNDKIKEIFGIIWHRSCLVLLVYLILKINTFMFENFCIMFKSRIYFWVCEPGLEKWMRYVLKMTKNSKHRRKTKNARWKWLQNVLSIIIDVLIIHFVSW